MLKLYIKTLCILLSASPLSALGNKPKHLDIGKNENITMYCGNWSYTPPVYPTDKSLSVRRKIGIPDNKTVTAVIYVGCDGEVYGFWLSD